MESFLTLLGMLFFMLLVLAASVEVVLEIFRGLLDVAGKDWLKRRVTLDEALALADEFAPDDASTRARALALSRMAGGIVLRADSVKSSLKRIDAELQKASEGGLPSIVDALGEVSAAVRDELARRENVRIWALRVSSALIGCILVWQSHFYVFEVLAATPEGATYLGRFGSLKAPWINVVVGGLASSAGSSYWHDQLDKVRALKSAIAETKKVRDTMTGASP